VAQNRTVKPAFWEELRANAENEHGAWRFGYSSVALQLKVHGTTSQLLGVSSLGSLGSLSSTQHVHWVQPVHNSHSSALACPVKSLPSLTAGRSSTGLYRRPMSSMSYMQTSTDMDMYTRYMYALSLETIPIHAFQI